MPVVSRGVGDEATHELQDVGLVLYVGDGVVVKRLREVDGVKRKHLVASLLKEPSRHGERLALGVGHEVAGVRLHDVGQKVEEGLAGARASHDRAVEVALPEAADVSFFCVERHAHVAREDDVVLGVPGIGEPAHLARLRPAGAAVLLSSAVCPSARKRVRPEGPDAAGGHEPRRERDGAPVDNAVMCNVDRKRLKRLAEVSHEGAREREQAGNVGVSDGECRCRSCGCHHERYLGDGAHRDPFSRSGAGLSRTRV